MNDQTANSSTFNIGEELEKIRSDYAEAVLASENHGTPICRTLSELRLREMQSTLYSVLIAVEHATSEEEIEQSGEAIFLFNAISSVLRSLKFDQRQAAV